MLTTNNRVVIPKKIKILFGIVSLLVLIFYGVYALIQMSIPDEVTSTSTSSAANVLNKDTSYDGVNINEADPQALSQYCEDTNAVAKRLSNGSSIKDLCVLSRIANDYLPLMSEQEIANMAENNPTCLTTGFDKDGFDCFTGFDASGCGRNGLNKAGEECTPINAEKTPAATSNNLNLLLSDKAQFCDMVQGCATDAKFDPMGFNQYGCDRQGLRKDGTACPHELVTKIFENGRDQFGFDTAGFNEKGCDRQGLNKQGKQCAYSDMTKTYDRDGLDPMGFNQQGFNKFGCNIDGLDAQGKACPAHQITRVIDPVTGLDQFGLDSDGFNEKGCNLEGVNREGLQCAIEDIPRIFGKDKKDQFGLRKDGRNEHNCDLSGLKPDGSLCKEDELTRIYSPVTGVDQFGLFPNGRNKFDCDAQGRKSDGSLCTDEERNVRVDPKTGLDPFGLTQDGYNEKGCNLQGFRRDGAQCDLKDIPRIFKDSGFDQLGLDKDGFNSKGCNLQGFNRNGERCQSSDIPRLMGPDGRDQFGLDKEGFNANGCDLSGLDRNGNMCASDLVTRIRSGDGVDQFGLNEKGFSVETGCNMQGYREDGSRCAYEDIPKRYNADGVNQFGMGKNGRNKNGCDINGIKPDGESCTAEEMTVWYDDENMSVFHRDPDGFDRLGFNPLGFNKNNCDISGRKPDGSLCDIADITRVYDPATGLDQFGLDTDGFNDKGCNLQGVNRQGEACPTEDIPRIFDARMNDQFGQSITSLPNSVWQDQADCLASISRVKNENGQGVMVYGKAAYRDAQGNIKDEKCVHIKTPNGSLVSLSPNGTLVDDQGQALPDSALQSLGGRGNIGLISEPLNKAPLIAADGTRLLVDGKEAFALADGTLVDAKGNVLRDAQGSPLRLNRDGVIVDGNGAPVDSQRLNIPNAGISGANKPLFGADGTRLLVDGKEAFSRADGTLVDAQGNVLRDTQGNPLRLNRDGVIVDGNGEPVDSQRLNAPNDGIKGAVAFVDGKPAFALADGTLVDAKGNPILDARGRPLRLSANGEVVDDNGVLIAPSRLTVPNTGFVRQEGASRAPAMELLTGSDGQPLMVNGKLAYVDGKGNIVDAQGRPILDKNSNPLRLNEQGQLIDSSGRVVEAEALPFDGYDGPNGGFSSSENSLGEQARLALDAMSNLTPDQRKSLGLNDDGFNAKGCALNGLNRAGEVCELEDIPRLFDENNFDQFGLRPDGFNAFGCNLQGLDRDGNACDADQIPRIFDLSDQDQLGFGRDGRNAAGLDLAGKNLNNCDASGQGPGCALKNAPRLLDAAGVDQFNKRGETRDRLGLVNGYNAAGCNIAGLTASGERCNFEDIPRVLDKNGRDQFGLDAQGRNRFGCDLEGRMPNGEICRADQITRIFDKNNRDQFGLDQQLRNAAGCDLNGLKADGTLCEVSDMPTITNTSGFNQFGLDAEGFNAKDCNLAGYNRQGERCAAEDIPRILDTAGRDQFGLDAQGRNIHGCDINGLKPDGSICPASEMVRIVDPATGLDQFGLDTAGFNAQGCNLAGYNAAGELCQPNDITQLFDINSVSQFGINKETGFNAQGCNIQGLDAKGLPCAPANRVKFIGKDGKDQFDLVNGFNEKGCDLNGRNAQGELCDFEDVTLIVNTETGLNQFELDQTGLNKAGCGVDGLDAAGNPCALSEIPRIFGADKRDQFDLDLKGFNKEGCNLLGFKADGSRCAPDAAPAIYGSDGFSQLGFNREHRDREGFDFSGFDKEGCDINNRRSDGTFCSKFQELDLTAEDGVYMAAKKAELEAWLTKHATKPTALGAGTYVAESDPLFAKPEPVSSQPVNLTAQNNSAGESGRNNTANTEQKVTIPMGMIFIIDVKTPVNSDYTQDVYATIIGSELDGAMLKGRIDVPYLDDPVMPRDKFRYSFNQLVWNRKSYPIDATTLNMDNDSGMVKADDVNYHRWQRYSGLLFATGVQALDATFLDNQAEKNAQQQAEALKEATAQSLVLGQNVDALARQNLKTATSHINELAQQQFMRRPTITKGPSQHLLIFNQEVVNDALPMVFDGIEQ